MALTPCSDLSAAGWIIDSDQPWEQLVGFGPSGFPAYARLRFLPDPAYAGQSESDADIAEDALSEAAQLRAALEVLARYTATPDDCYLCLWDGWESDVAADSGAWTDRPRTGTARPGLAPPSRPSRVDRPKVTIPHRAYFLFRGAVLEFGDRDPAGTQPGLPREPDMPNPAFIWPADHAWCVANDVDPHWAGIGADRSAIDHLVADPRLDVVLADPRQDQPAYR